MLTIQKESERQDYLTPLPDELIENLLAISFDINELVELIKQPISKKLTRIFKIIGLNIIFGSSITEALRLQERYLLDLHRNIYSNKKNNEINLSNLTTLIYDSQRPLFLRMLAISTLLVQLRTQQAAENQNSLRELCCYAFMSYLGKTNLSEALFLLYPHLASVQANKINAFSYLLSLDNSDAYDLSTLSIQKIQALGWITPQLDPAQKTKAFNTIITIANKLQILQKTKKPTLESLSMTLGNMALHITSKQRLKAFHVLITWQRYFQSYNNENQESIIDDNYGSIINIYEALARFIPLLDSKRRKISFQILICCLKNPKSINEFGEAITNILSKNAAYLNQHEKTIFLSTFINFAGTNDWNIDVNLNFLHYLDAKQQTYLYNAIFTWSKQNEFSGSGTAVLILENLLPYLKNEQMPTIALLQRLAEQVYDGETATAAIKSLCNIILNWISLKLDAEEEKTNIMNLLMHVINSEDLQSNCELYQVICHAIVETQPEQSGQLVTTLLTYIQNPQQEIKGDTALALLCSLRKFLTSEQQAAIFDDLIAAIPNSQTILAKIFSMLAPYLESPLLEKIFNILSRWLSNREVAGQDTAVATLPYLLPYFNAAQLKSTLALVKEISIPKEQNFYVLMSEYLIHPTLPNNEKNNLLSWMKKNIFTHAYVIANLQSETILDILTSPNTSHSNTTMDIAALGQQSSTFFQPASQQKDTQCPTDIDSCGGGRKRKKPDTPNTQESEAKRPRI